MNLCPLPLFDVVGSRCLSPSASRQKVVSFKPLSHGMGTGMPAGVAQGEMNYWKSGKMAEWEGARVPLTLADAFQSSPSVAISSAHHTPNLHKCSACYSSTTSHTQHSTSGEGNFTVEKSGGNLSTPNFIGATPSATRKRCAPCVNGTTRTRTDAASGH